MSPTSPILRPSLGPGNDRRPGTMYVSGGGNSLLEFRSESDPAEEAQEETEAVPAARKVRRSPFTFLTNRKTMPVALLIAAAITGGLTVTWLLTRDTPAAAAAPAAPAAENAAAAALPAAPPAPTTGTLDISSDPPGARVIIDGTPRGSTPVSLKDMAPGPHAVSIVAGNTTIERTVSVEAGTTSTVLASVVPARPGAGWVSVEMPFRAEIVENGRLLGTTGTERLALPAGWHELELRNTDLGFRASLSVQIVPGQVARPSLNAPNGLLSVNAIPWANVTIDGRDHGTTPLANLSLPIGRHEIVLKHPSLGERRESVTVTGSAPVRVGVTFGQ